MKKAVIAGLAAASLAAPVYANEADASRFEVIYTADVLANAAGGLEQASRYLDNLDVTLALDGERLAGWRGGSIFLYGLYNNGASFSGDLVGDEQGVSNIETGAAALRLYEAWVEQSFADGRASVRAGLYDLNSEFDAIETAGLFLSSSHGIGPEFAQSGRNGPSIFPSTSLAVRGAVAINDAWTIRAVVLDGVPGDPDHPERTAIRLSDDDGALLTAELGYAGHGQRAAFGYWRYTAKHEVLLATAMSGTPVYADGADGAYVYLEASPAEGWSAWLRLGVAAARFNAVAGYLGAGLVRTGVFVGREADQMGVALAWAGYGDDYRAARAWEGAPVERGELALELTYRAALSDRFALQPHIQYIIDPSGDPGLDDALVIGLRLEAVLWSVRR